MRKMTAQPRNIFMATFAMEYGARPPEDAKKSCLTVSRARIEPSVRETRESSDR